MFQRIAPTCEHKSCSNRSTPHWAPASPQPAVHAGVSMCSIRGPAQQCMVPPAPHAVAKHDTCATQGCCSYTHHLGCLVRLCLCQSPRAHRCCLTADASCDHGTAAHRCCYNDSSTIASSSRHPCSTLAGLYCTETCALRPPAAVAAVGGSSSCRAKLLTGPHGCPPEGSTRVHDNRLF
jgi:hypothetical protein